MNALARRKRALELDGEKKTEDNEDDGYDAVYIEDMVEDNLSTTLAIQGSNEDERRDRNRDSMTIENPYYDDGDIDLTENGQGNAKQFVVVILA